MDSGDRFIRIESVRLTNLRSSYGDLRALSESIRDEGMRHPVTVWQNGTLISGERRVRAHMLLGRPAIQATFVHTIEDAAKALKRDNDDTHLSQPWKPSEVCRLWELLRRLDEPAARKRADEARRRGVKLRRETLSGKRKPGRSHGRSDDYVLSVIAPPFDMSEASARRLLSVYNHANGITDATDEHRELAREILADIDARGNIWANYQRLMGTRSAPPTRPRPVVPRESVPVRRQMDAWARALPQMEGLVAGLIELGPPNAELTWDQVGPVHARLAAVRRELEKMIKQMKEISQS